MRFDEILPVASDEGGAVGNTEWIELHNAGATAVDVAGWSVRGGLNNITTVDASNLATPVQERCSTPMREPSST